MLPVGYQDATTVMEVSPAVWRSVFDAAGDAKRLKGVTPLKPPDVWQPLTSEEPRDELSDALRVIFELGTDAAATFCNRRLTISRLHSTSGPLRQAAIW